MGGLPNDPQEIENEEVLYLARLNFLQKIQNLNKKNKRFRQVKNDLTRMIADQENRLNMIPIIIEKDQNFLSSNHEMISQLAYNDLETDPTDFFYEEINLDE
ncbi:hypothetical protein [Acinetobacter pittii]|uniref:hypothetical protein n=1 Tax=Acinetobacter pittii TaxID=48296 RepID=UPI001F3262AA|nr:hypothetical protein [Acinetobacter pittii]MCF1280706.1 hypothetical protein [Acinetobacter pittii]